MEKLKIVNEVITNLEKRNWENVENKLTNDFTFSGAVDKPIDKKQWVGVHKAIQAGIPDLKFNLQQMEQKGDNKITAKVKLTGTHTANMPSPLPGANSIPATGKRVSLPEEELEFTLNGDKISGLFVKPVPHGGVMGIIEQIQGVEAGSSNR